MNFILAASPTLFFGGIGFVLVTVTTGEIRVLATPESHRNRISATSSFLSGITIPFGVLVGGYLVEFFGVTAAIVGLGSLILICLASIFCCAHLRRILAMDDQSLKESLPSAISSGISLAYPVSIGCTAKIHRWRRAPTPDRYYVQGQI